MYMCAYVCWGWVQTHLHVVSKTVEFREAENRIVVSRGWSEGKWGIV